MREREENFVGTSKFLCDYFWYTGTRTLNCVRTVCMYNWVGILRFHYKGYYCVMGRNSVYVPFPPFGFAAIAPLVSKRGFAVLSSKTICGRLPHPLAVAVVPSVNLSTQSYGACGARVQFNPSTECAYADSFCGPSWLWTRRCQVEYEILFQVTYYNDIRADTQSSQLRGDHRGLALALALAFDRSTKLRLHRGHETLLCGLVNVH